MRFRGLVAGLFLLSIGLASTAGARQAEGASATKWISEAVDRAGAEWTALPRADADRCVVSLRSESKSMLDAIASMPIDLSRPLTVVYVVGQGFESTAISVIGFDRQGRTTIAFDDLSSREHRTLSRALTNRVEGLVSAILHGEVTTFNGVLDGECTLVIRKEGSRLFPPGYGAVNGADDALQQLKTAINEVFSTSAVASGP